MNNFQLSIAIITKNEESNLPVLFSSIEKLRKFLKLQVVVVDTGSTDSTLEIAGNFGAELTEITWENNFSMARNVSLSKCTAPWILWMDADDILSEKAISWLGANVAELSQDKVFSFTILSKLDGGEENSFSQIRLIPGNLGLKFENPIHESLAESIVEKNLSGISTGCQIIHTGYARDAVVQEKNQRNKKILRELVEAGSQKLSILFSLARTLQVEKNYPESLALFEKILSRPDAGQIQADIYTASVLYTGQILGFQGKLEEAREIFEKFFPEGENNPQYLFEMGKILFVLGKKSQAGELFTRCLALKGFNWTIPTSWNEIYQGAEDLLIKIKEQTVSSSIPEGDDNISKLQQKFSICTILKNEASNIPGICNNLPFEKIEWIAVDTGSTDTTKQELLSRGIQPLSFEWSDDFSLARNFSLKKATRPWIMWLDADDRLSTDFWDKLADVMNLQDESNENNTAYRCIIKSDRDDGTRDYFLQTRIFPNFLNIEFEGRIHENLGSSLIKTGLKIEDTDLLISHGGYYNSEDREAKLNRNFAYLQKEYADKPDDPKVACELGNCYFQMKNFQMALDTYLKVLDKLGLSSESLPPNDNILICYPALIGNTLVELQKKEEAETWYALAGSWNPEDLSSYYWFGKKALEQKNLEKAAEIFKKIVLKPVHISQVASDNITIRRNSLGFLVVLSLQKQPFESGQIEGWLEELRQGGLDPFPLDYQIPEKFYTATQNLTELENYYQEYLAVFPEDLAMWENYLEWLIGQNRFSDIIQIMDSSSSLRGKSGVLEAFLARSIESLPVDQKPATNPYNIYINALEHFPENPTLVVYFTELLNQKKNYSQALEDLGKLPRLSRELVDLQQQLKAQVQT